MRKQTGVLHKQTKMEKYNAVQRFTAYAMYETAKQSAFHSTK